MRKYSLLISAALLALIAVANTARAESIERADQKDIEMLLSAASGTNSAYWACFIGEARGRVYIEYETAVHAGSLFSEETKRVVFWLPRSEITNEQLAQFKSYKEKQENQPAQNAGEASK